MYIMIIYLDIIFLENLFMNYIILFAVAVIMKERVRAIRIAIASSLGSMYAILVYMSIAEVFSNIILIIILSMVMVYIAFTPKSIKSMIKQLMFFYLTSFTFGGATFALLYLLKSQGVLPETRRFGRARTYNNTIVRWNCSFYSYSISL